MEDDALNEFLSSARRAQDRMDTSRSELAFETKMQAVVRNTRQETGPAARFQIWLRAAAGLATITGIIAFAVLARREAQDSEDTLNAWWTSNATAWDLELFN